MTDQELEEIERVWAAVTPGTWSLLRLALGRDESWLQVVNEAGDTRLLTELYGNEADETAIAASKAHVAALIAEVKRLREVNDQLIGNEQRLREGAGLLVATYDAFARVSPQAAAVYGQVADDLRVLLGEVL